jgi:multicomponent Na+:H+ antiporter subunit A
MPLIVIVALPFLIAPLVGWLRRAGDWALAVVPAAMSVWLVTLANNDGLASQMSVVYPWVPQIGVEFALRLDGLSLLFALLVSGIGALVIAYSGYYLAGHPHVNRFQSYTLLFMGSMLGLVLADDAITLFVFWELTSVTSFLLIGFHHEEAKARYGALKALLITAGGGLALLLGLVVVGQMADSLRLSEWVARGEMLQAHPLYLPVLILILTGAFAKSAQVPFHIWLPDAMQAPTPASTYLHSATMVKAGVYLLARLYPAMGGNTVWRDLVAVVGLTTLVWGAYLAFKQTDLKALLAYTTVSALGLMVALIGVGTSAALKALMVVIMAHAFYKAALFLIVGIVDHATGTRDLMSLGGLARQMPVSAVLATTAALSMAGLPPLFGFLAKEKAIDSVLGWEATSIWAIAGPLAVVVGAIWGVAYSILLVYGIFLGKPRSTPKNPHEAPAGMLVAPAVLAVLSVLTVWPPLREGAASLLGGAAGVVLGKTAQLDLELWHSVNLSMALSVVAVVCGSGMFFLRHRVWTLQAKWPAWAQVDHLYDGGVSGLNRLAVALTNRIQTGSLRHYLIMTLGALVAAVALALATSGGLAWPATWSLDGVQPYEIAAAGMMILAALALVIAPTRLGAIAAISTVGYLMAFFYVLYSGPDLALTQLLVETLTVVLLLLVFHFLPRFFEDHTAKLTRLRDGLIAAGVGALVTLLLILVLPQTPDLAVSDYYIKNSLPLAYGANVVNVILVDFRALDTLGEITVLIIAALGVFGMMRFRVRRRVPVEVKR